MQRYRYLAGQVRRRPKRHAALWPLRLDGAQNVQFGVAPISIKSDRLVDQIGGYARGLSLVAVTVRGGVQDLRRE
jgi:hypothetical protein